MSTRKISELQALNIKLSKIEKQLEKVRGCSPLTHGWQTQQYAKASRKWDMLGLEKLAIQVKIDELTNSKSINVWGNI